MLFAICWFLQVLRGKTNFFTPSCPSWEAFLARLQILIHYFKLSNTNWACERAEQTEAQVRVLRDHYSLCHHLQPLQEEHQCYRRSFSHPCIWTIYNVWHYCCCSLKPNWAECIASRRTKLLWQDGTTNIWIMQTFILTALQKYLQILDWKHLIMDSQNYSCVATTCFTC